MLTISRHVVAWLVSAAVVSVMPAVSAELSWRLSDWIGDSGGLSFYARDWRSSEPRAIAPGTLINPLGPGPLVLLAFICLTGVLGERGLRKRPCLRWALPVIPAIGIGSAAMVAVALALPADVPRSTAVVVGVAACVAVGMVAAVYWGVLRSLVRSPV